MPAEENEAAVVFVDADNTLWETDAVYATAQLDLLSAVEKAVGVVAPTEDRLGFVRSIDQSIAQRHHAGLRYPPKLLVKALALVLKGVPPKTATRRAWQSSDTDQTLSDDAAARIEGAFLSALRTLPALRTGVRNGLVALREAGSVVFIITEGGRDRVLRLARVHGLESLFDRVIEAPKGPRIYLRALRLLRRPANAFMVGDQLDRDIRPAKEAGLKTIYFPGGFRPSWEPNEASVRPDFHIDRFDMVPRIVLAKAV
ncbi:HAD family hydrolase [Dongia deserti]|uniref:HAD family hydrolase n=1 Tax=Dongia deserti TaxID=2268030 RepID=UPI000E656B43|nr:HAD family hydrolase [Dongia deserti]